MPQGIHTGIASRDKRPGLLVLPSASCSATPQRSRPKPPQPDLFAPRYASMMYICRPRAPHFTSITPRAASACLGTVSAPLFWCLRPARNYAPGQAYWNRDGRISDQESPFCRFAEGPTGTRANLRQESGRSSRDIITTTGAGSSGLITAPAPGVRAWATPFCPFLAKTGGSMRFFVAIIFFPVRAYRRSVYISVQASIILVLLQVGMTGDLSLLVLQDTFHELTLQPHQSPTA